MARLRTTSKGWHWIAIAVLLALTALPGVGQAQTPQEVPDPLRDVGFDQRLDAQVPLDLTFRDEAGQTVALADLLHGKPVILAMGYYECPMLCSLVRDGVLTALRELDFDVGDQFSVIYVSIDPLETPMIAAAQKTATLQRYDRPGAAEHWHFLTGDKPNIDALAEAIGFHYLYDEKTDQYAHASGIVVLTPRGKISRYFYGIEYSLRDLRLGLVESAENKIGNPVDRLLLLCYHYDPVTGQYSGLVMTLLRTAGAITTLSLGLFIFRMLRTNRRTVISA